ncbi:MAG: GntR family transcriptional regulator [Candidatus Sulfotelmatobacter sp.]
MGQNHRDGVAAYKKIQSAILERIEGGHLKPGDAVHSERELAKLHSVSLMTARHALTELEREGIVTRRRGAGTFVAPPKIHFNKLVGFTEQMVSRGLQASSRTLVAKVVSAEPEIAARLNLSPSASLVKVERLRQGGGEPFSLETCYLSAERFAGLARDPVAHSSLFAILERDYKLEIAYADEEIDAIAADARMADLFGVAKGSPLLRIRQVIFSTAGRPEIYVLGIYRADRHTLLVRRFR